MAVTSVASTTTSTTLLAANNQRRSYYIKNDDANPLYLLCASGTASSTNYTEKLDTGDAFSDDTYTGEVTGVWTADGSGSARVTENELTGR